MIINWEFIETKAQLKFGHQSTIELLATTAGFTRQQYYNARRKDSMSLNSLVKIAKALDVEIPELFHTGQTNAKEEPGKYTPQKRVYDGEMLDQLNLSLSSIERKLDSLINKQQDNKKQ